MNENDCLHGTISLNLLGSDNSKTSLKTHYPEAKSSKKIYEDMKLFVRIFF